MACTRTGSASQQDRSLAQRFVNDVINARNLDGALVEMVAARAFPNASDGKWLTF